MSRSGRESTRKQPCVMQVNTRDMGGGAARIAWELFTAYRDRGLYSKLAVGYKHSGDPDVLLIPSRRAGGSWSRFWEGMASSLDRSKMWGRLTPLARGLARTLAEPGRSLDFHLGLEDFRYPGGRSLLSLPGQRPDIIHGHNLHGYYFDLRVLPWLSRRVPVVLTLHDAWMLTGHCAHPLDCLSWKGGCGHCPELGIYPPVTRDTTAYNWRRKKGIYARSLLHVATPSRWLMNKLTDSMLAASAVQARVIPNGVDLSVFRPGTGQASRSALGISQEARVLLFAANGVRENTSKDYRTLREAVARVAEGLPGESILFLALGEAGPTERTGRAELRFIPYLTDVQVVARYYQATDVYVHAALADTFPTSVLEAVACGTPVVATAVGGIPEQIDDTVTGFLAPKGDAEALAGRITELLLDGELRQRMGIKAAESARQRFDLRRQVDSYLEWYSELMQSEADAQPSEAVGCAA